MEPPPRSPNFIRVVHTVSCVVRRYRRLAKRPCLSTTIQDLYATLSYRAKCPNTSTHLMSLYYTKKRPNHNLIYTVDHTFGYHSKKFICSHSSPHTHGTEFRGGNFKPLMDGSPLTRRFANGCQMVIQGQECFTKHGSPQMIPPVV